MDTHQESNQTRAYHSLTQLLQQYTPLGLQAPCCRCAGPAGLAIQAVMYLVRTLNT